MDDDSDEEPPYMVYVEPTAEELSRHNGSLMDYRFEVRLQPESCEESLSEICSPLAYQVNGRL